MGNTDVTWETADKQNYGIDANFFGSAFLNFDYFFEHRTGILLSPNSTPGIIAAGLPALNIGEVDNHGYEIALGWKETTRRGFNYYVNANVSFARNKILYMDEVKSQFAYQHQTGGPTGRYTGLYKFEGCIRIATLRLIPKETWFSILPCHSLMSLLHPAMPCMPI